MTDTVPADEVVELRPAGSVLVRHRGADLEARADPRSGPVITLREGALWVRADEGGPGVTVTHGASSVEVRSGAVVLEVSDVEALLVVVSGRASVGGVSPVPRTVVAGHACSMTLDGVLSAPVALSADELAGDRMIVQNLARDTLGADLAALAVEPAVRVDPPPPPTFDRAGEVPSSGATTNGAAADPDEGAGPGGDPVPGHAVRDRVGGAPATAGRRRRRWLIAVVVLLVVAAVVAAVLLGWPVDVLGSVAPVPVSGG